MENLPPPIFRIQNQMRRVGTMAKKSFELGFVKARTVGNEDPIFLTTQVLESARVAFEHYRTSTHPII
jgi:hypothetical protein